MPKVKSSDWKHLQFNVFFYKSIKNTFFYVLYLQMNVLTSMLNVLIVKIKINN